jgi:hypothetical protein
MSSSPAPSQVDQSGFKPVREVLRAAGRRGSQSDASSDMKRGTSVFLSHKFRGGMTTKSALLSPLADLKRSTPGARFDQLPADSAVDRWLDEGGR